MATNALHVNVRNRKGTPPPWTVVCELLVPRHFKAKIKKGRYGRICTYKARVTEFHNTVKRTSLLTL